MGATNCLFCDGKMEIPRTEIHWPKTDFSKTATIELVYWDFGWVGIKFELEIFLHKSYLDE